MQRNLAAAALLFAGILPAGTIELTAGAEFAPLQGTATFTINSDTHEVIRTNFVNPPSLVTLNLGPIQIPEGSIITSAILNVVFDSTFFGWSPRFPQSVKPIDPNLPFEGAQIFDDEGVGHTVFRLAQVLSKNAISDVDIQDEDNLEIFLNLQDVGLDLQNGDEVTLHAAHFLGDADFYPYFLPRGTNAISTFDVFPPNQFFANVGAKLEITFEEVPEPSTLWLGAPVLLSGLLRSRRGR